MCAGVGTWVEETMALDKALRLVPNPRLVPAQPGIGAHIPPLSSRVLDSLGATTEPLPHGGQSERVGDKSVPQARLEVLPAAQGRLVALPGLVARRPPPSPSNLTNSTSPLARLQHLQRPFSPHPSVGQLSGRLSIPAHSSSLLPAVSRNPLPLAPNPPPRRRQAEVHRDSFQSHRHPPGQQALQIPHSQRNRRASRPPPP